MRACVIMVSSLLVAACGGGDGDSLEGRWVGELVSGVLPSGSPRVVLSIERANDGEPFAGAVVFGAGAAPSAPTDPAVGWPTGIDPLDLSMPVADGFTYAASGSRAGPELMIDVAITDLWAPWCALQTPYPLADGADQALCVPNRDWSATPFGCQLEADATSPIEPIDCLKLTLCRRAPVCDCTVSSGCAPSERGLTLSLDLEISGGTATGSFVWSIDTGGGGVARVELTRE